MTTGKTIALMIWTFVGKVMSLLFNMLFRLVITFLPRSKCLSWLQSPSVVILEPPKIKSVTVSTVSPSICHEVMGPDGMVLIFWMLSYTLSTCNDRTLWWQSCWLCPSSASVSSPATPWIQSPALWSISLCNRLTHLYVHIKASRIDNHLFSRKQWGTVIPQCGYSSRAREWSAYGSKVSDMNVLVSQNIPRTEVMFTLH